MGKFKEYLIEGDISKYIQDIQQFFEENKQKALACKKYIVTNAFNGDDNQIVISYIELNVNGNPVKGTSNKEKFGAEVTILSVKNSSSDISEIYKCLQQKSKIKSFDWIKKNIENPRITHIGSIK